MNQEKNCAYCKDKDLRILKLESELKEEKESFAKMKRAFTDSQERFSKLENIIVKIIEVIK